MKYQETSTTMRYKWDHVANMFYRRYPNVHSKHVLSEDIIFRKLDGNVLKTMRLYKKTNETPSWLKQILPSASAYILEESHIDPVAKTIVTYSKNITLTTFLHVQEKTIFSEDNTNKDWTSVKRNAWIISSFYGLSYGFEAYGLNRYKSNIQRMDRGFESVLKRINQSSDQHQLKYTSYSIANTI